MKMTKKSKEPSAPYREVFFGSKSWQARRSLISSPKEYRNQAQPKFCSNAVKTSKYTWWNFLPKNLFEQFRRVGNLFFLAVAVVQLVLRDSSPVSPIPSVSAFIVVITVAAVKQAYEDIKRHRADDKVNNAPCTVVREGREVRVKFRDVTAGDFLKVYEDENIPCDLVLLASSNSDGHCYVTTANLDGEANLKRLESASVTLQTMTEASALRVLTGVIECEHPHADLYKFYGRLCMMMEGKREVFPLNASNLLLGGSTLKDTPYIYACAIYTGPQTKMGLNLKLKSIKFSTAERAMNKIVIFLLALLFAEIFVVSFLYFYSEDYSVQRENAKDSRSATDILFYLILLNYIVPISLYVSIEFQKLMGAKFFVYDADMYDEEENLWPICNTSDISEELGQINYLFSDKTGTLTENVMILRNICVDDQTYHLTDAAELLDETEDRVETFNPPLRRLFLNFLLNHTVQVVVKEGTTSFKASSPDEKAFLEAAHRLGVKWEVNKLGETVIEFQGTVCRYQVLNILEFDAHRKCMSVIVKDLSEKTIYVLTKGAESSLEKSIVEDDSKLIAFHHVEEFASSGLRTLVFGERRIDDATYSTFQTLLDEARCDLADRESKLSSLYESIEKDLICVGATGIEDVLQQGVRDTLVSLHRAGIHIWVLTGDKKSTAVHISYACGHFNKSMLLHELVDTADLNELDQKLGAINDSLELNTKSHSLVVDGKTLTLIMAERKKAFSNISHQCATVLCCRMSPLQKAQIVSMVKEFKEHPVCAAIGDGANDVSMIQEANVGIAIVGKEGRQATRCSDFAFAKFRFLKKAVLVHGQWYYYRISVFIMYSVYKSATFITPQLYYTAYTLYSGATLFQSVYLMLFNMMFTALPIITFGVMEQNYPKGVLLAEPELYRDLTKNRYMSAFVFFAWFLMIIYHSAISFFIPFGMIQSYVPLNGAGYAILSNWDFGILVYTANIIVVNLTLFYITKYWTVLSHVSYWGTLMVYLVFSTVFSFFWTDVHLSFLQTFSVAPPLLCLMLTVVVGLIPVVIILVVYNQLQIRARSTMRHQAREMQQLSVSVACRDSNLTNDSLSGSPLITNDYESNNTQRALITSKDEHTQRSYVMSGKIESNGNKS